MQKLERSSFIDSVWLGGNREMQVASQPLRILALLDTSAARDLRIPAVNARIESRNELDTMVVNVELTVNSIIQGVALSFLVDGARNVLTTGGASMWLYVYAG